MKIITEEKLKEILSDFIRANDPDQQVISSLIDYELEEIDTLTVSKPRPMGDLQQCQYVNAYRSGEGFECVYLNIYQRLLGFGGQEVKQDEFEGWIPMPTYKLELTGNGE